MNRYIRLETMWDASPWLDVLSAEAQLVWVKLLCYVKGHGRDGRAKALVPLRAARMWNVGDESVRQLLKAAEMHGALSIDDQDWVIVKWQEYQGDSTAAERMRKMRSKPKPESVTDVTRNEANVTRDREKTETDTPSSNQDPSRNYIEPNTAPTREGHDDDLPTRRRVFLEPEEGREGLDAEFRSLASKMRMPGGD